MGCNLNRAYKARMRAMGKQLPGQEKLLLKPEDRVVYPVEKTRLWWWNLPHFRKWRTQ